MTSTGHIFLSYRTIEAEFALKLAADLKNAGVRLWMDRLDGIRVGMDWRDAIEQAINNSMAMIAVLSPDYVKAEYCRKELARANSLKLPIFPVLLRPLVVKEVPFAIEGVQWEDFTRETEYLQRLGNLLKRIQEEMPQQVGQSPEPETRYLTRLIAELESRRGVLEYVALDGKPEESQDVRPQPHPEDEWGFTELLDVPATSARVSAPRQVALASIAEAVAKHPQFVLLGDPGAGKTTTVRRLARDAARARLENPHSSPLPLLLYLPQWGDEPTPLDFVRARWPFGTDPAGALKTGDVLLYLDGLNEMGAGSKHKAGMLGAWLAGRDAPRRVIITCRSADYRDDLVLDNKGGTGRLPTVQAQPLGEAQMCQFTVNYLGDKSKSFLTHLSASGEQGTARSLLRLASNPYMLSALIFLYEHAPAGKLPTNSGALFRRLARALWAREARRSAAATSITFEHAEAAFAELAFAQISEDKPVDVPVSYAVEKLPGAGLLSAGVGANYLNRTSDSVRFYHQLMQEYFAAMKLLRHEELQGAVLPRPKKREEAIQPKWREVIIAMCGASDDPDRSVRRVCESDPYLAADCVASGVSVRAETLFAVVEAAVLDIEALFEWIDKSLDHVSVGDGSCFDYLRVLTEQAEQNVERSKRRIAAALLELGESACPVLVEALKHPLSRVRKTAAELLTEVGCQSADPQTALLVNIARQDWPACARAGEAAVAPLVQCLRDGDSSVRYQAANVLDGMEWAPPDTQARAAYLLAKNRWDECVELGTAALPLIVERLRHPRSSSWERDSAASALQKFGALALLALAECLRDANEKVRWRAAEVLGSVGDASVIPLLAEALGDSDYDVRRHAAQSLSRFGKAAVPALVEALGRGDWLVTSRAAEALGDIGDASAVPALKTALRGADSYTKSSVAEALKKLRPRDARVASKRRGRKKP